MTELPQFRYHPHPVDTGAVEERSHTCVSCGKVRSHVYVGPTYALCEVDELCPWCIADGTAAAKFGASFVDSQGLGHLSNDVVETVTTRTPSFIGWQQEQWLSHCDDACAFVDRVGSAELNELPTPATQAVRTALVDWSPTEAIRNELFSHLHRDGDLTAYLFQCLHCGEYVAYLDAS